MTTIAFTIDEEMLARIDRLARGGSKARSRSLVIRTALDWFLKRQAQIEEEERERKVFHARRASLARQTRALVREQTRR